MATTVWGPGEDGLPNFDLCPSQRVPFVTLVDAATITPNACLSNNFAVTLGGNRTMANPTNLRDGIILNFLIKQDGTGSRTLTWGSKYKWPGGTAVDLTNAAAAVDFVCFIYNQALDILIGSYVLDVK